MFGKTKSLFFIVTSLLFIASCDSIREVCLGVNFGWNSHSTTIWNMRMRSIRRVKSVDVFVFDSDDKLVLSKRGGIY